MLLEPRFFPLGQDAIGDVDDHRPRVLTVRFRARPELNPHRAAVVLTTQLQLRQTALLALLNVGERIVDSLADYGIGRDQRHADRARHFLRLQP